jgi:hypothetical protein
LFLDLPEVRLEYDSVALLFRRIRIRRILFRLDEIRIVRNAQGQTNLDLFRERLARGRAASTLTHWNWEYDGTEYVTFAVGRLNYLDVQDPQKSEEIYAGVRGVTLKPLRSGLDILIALARIAESRGAVWTAEALTPSQVRRVGTAKAP